VGSESLAELEEAFLQCDEEGIRTRVAVDFFPHVNSTVSLDRFGPTPLLTFSAAPYDEIRLLVKRVTDIVIAVAGLVVLAPLMLGIAILIRLTSPGPAIFRQVRCGLNGRRFLFYKFRSMCQNAEDLKDGLAHLSTRETAFKIPDDPRLTGLGRYLRKFSVDEWPQLWNVLRGDMSLVGPRPERPHFVEQFKHRIPQYMLRHKVKAGLTGWAQVHGWRGNTPLEKRIEYDLYYIENWSVRLDLKIMWLTLVNGFFHKHAY